MYSMAYEDRILSVAQDGFQLSLTGDHGLNHWMRVQGLGEYLAKKTEGADAEVVWHFALLHDMARVSEYSDPHHGPRAGALIMTMRHLNLSHSQRELLTIAIEDHSEGRVTKCPTIGCCWDSDRLDLPRVGVIPDPALMSTVEGKFMAAQLMAKHDNG